MSGKKSKQKGARGEREWAKFLSDRGIEARRGRQHSGLAAIEDQLERSLEERERLFKEAPDVVSSLKHIHWEVKRVEKLSLYPAMDQANKDADLEGKIPIVAHRRNKRKWLVVLYASDFIKLITEEND